MGVNRAKIEKHFGEEDRSKEDSVSIMNAANKSYFDKLDELKLSVQKSTKQ